MRVTMLGTGAADGWPNAFCRCASCHRMRRDGHSRAQTSALVDDALLLDCGSMTMHQAAAAGITLDGVRAMAITHVHPDHCSPATLMFRSWVRTDSLDVIGPPDVTEAARQWLAPDTPVRFRPVAAGDEIEVAGYRIRVLAARHRGPGAAVLYDVTTPDGGRLLYATDTGPLPDETVEAARDRTYDLVLIEETFGTHADHGTDHLDLTTFPLQLQRLRAVRAVNTDTDVIAVHLSHHNPAGDELGRRLGDWGARVLPDGSVWDSEGRPPAVVPARTLVLGGARSGKSREAEQTLADRGDVVYVATSGTRDDDPEWLARVAAHRARRHSGWQTAETLDLVALLGSEGPPLLIDCLTLWLTGIMDALGAWNSDNDGLVLAAIEELVAAWSTTSRRVVAVSNEVGSGIVPDTTSGRLFRDLLGRLNAELAAVTEDVRLVVAGRVVAL